MPECEVVLDTGAVCIGDTVCGKVVCSFPSDTKVREITCQLVGKEKTRIRQKRQIHFGMNVLFEQSQILVGEDKIPTGYYEFNFSFTLPTYIPATFSGKTGWIYYYVKATVNRPYMIDYEHKVTLTVSSPRVDFNHIRENLQLSPVVYESEKRLCCCCCASEPITLSLSLEKEAFVLGEVAKIVVKIMNMSETSVQELELSLTKHLEFFNKENSELTTEVKDLIAVEKASGVGPHGSRIYRINFLIPPTINITNLNNSTLIKRQFVLMAKAVLPSFHENFSVCTAIVLGHIPILSSQDSPVYQMDRLGIEIEDSELPYVTTTNPCVIF
ncbi:unnamed protein product [Phyllotreta striolata]|uniref:Arrestin C-terminal-like domain-containing protein n=1 Tax=Phyllotreta striolata TaxID=444603 RepID=A0A9N9TVS4_PHYSR|nr:unnamed protein product [Phyllotreta striolata]